MAETTANSDLKTVPKDWPGAFGIYKYSKQAVMLNIQTILLIILVNILINGLSTAVFKRDAGNFLGFILGALIATALYKTYLASLRGQQTDLKKAFSDAIPFWLRMLGLEILVVLSLVGSLLLFVVPFFFVLPRLVLATYFLVDKDMSIMDAYKASWNATKGHSSLVWGIIGAGLAMALLMLTIIGIPFALYFLFMYQAAFAVLYVFISRQAKTA